MSWSAVHTTMRKTSLPEATGAASRETWCTGPEWCCKWSNKLAWLTAERHLVWAISVLGNFSTLLFLMVSISVCEVFLILFWNPPTFPGSAWLLFRPDSPWASMLKTKALRSCDTDAKMMGRKLAGFQCLDLRCFGRPAFLVPFNMSKDSIWKTYENTAKTLAVFRATQNSGTRLRHRVALAVAPALQGHVRPQRDAPRRYSDHTPPTTATLRLLKAPQLWSWIVKSQNCIYMLSPTHKLISFWCASQNVIHFIWGLKDHCHSSTCQGSCAGWLCASKRRSPWSWLLHSWMLLGE